MRQDDLLRAINRLHDDTGGKVTGRITVGDLDVYARDTQPELVRSRVGMVFQRPNPFPTMSIFDNVVAGLRLNGVRNKALLREAAEAALHHAALWDLVKDRLHAPAVRLSGASSSGCASPGPWPSSPRSCSWTSPARRSTPSPRPRSRSSSPGCRPT